MDKVFGGLEGVLKIFDDILIYAQSLTVLKKRSHAFLDQYRNYGVKQAKSQVGVNEVDFAGFRLSSTGIQASPDLLKSIRDFPRPRNLTDRRSWFDIMTPFALFLQRMKFSNGYLNTTMPSLK